MDFRYLTLAFGAVLGSASGIHKLCHEPPTHHDHHEIETNQDISQSTEIARNVCHGISDYVKGFGIIGSSAVKGMIVYPLLPPVLWPLFWSDCPMHNVTHNEKRS